MRLGRFGSPSVGCRSHDQDAIGRQGLHLAATPRRIVLHNYRLIEIQRDARNLSEISPWLSPFPHWTSSSVAIRRCIPLSACRYCQPVHRRNSGLHRMPLGAFLALVDFPGRTFLVVVMNAFMGLPPVVVGLAVYLLPSHSGPFGFLSEQFRLDRAVCGLLCVHPCFCVRCNVRHRCRRCHAGLRYCCRRARDAFP
jgi:hypothetical protein